MPCMQKLNPVFLVIVLLALLPGGSASALDAPEAAGTEESSRQGIVTANVLNVRARPATHYEVVAKLERGTIVDIVSEKDGWLEIIAPPNTTAWIAAEYVMPDGTVTGDRVRVHSGPGLVFTTYAYVNEGDHVELLGAPANEWQKIQPPGDAKVWVSRAYVQIEKPATPPPAPAEVVDDKDEAQDADTPPDTDEAEVAEAEESDTAEPEKPEQDDDTETIETSVTGADETGLADADEGTTDEIPALKPPVLVPPDETVQESPPDTDVEEAGEEEYVTTVVTSEENGSRSEKGSDIESNETDIGEEETIGMADEEETAESEPVPVTKSTPVLREGVLLPLDKPASGIATHFLGVQIHRTCYPVCYLYSERLDLAEWEKRTVRVRGLETWYPGWSKPVIDVRSIIIRQ